MIALPSLFCPSTAYMQIICDFPDTVIYIGETYQKQTLRNRCTLMTANGQVDFTFPVMKYDYPTPPSNKILISEHGAWRHRLEYTLRSAYKVAPFWDHYEAKILDLIYNRSFQTLVDYNKAWMNFICEVLDLSSPAHVTDLPREAEFHPEYGETTFPKTVKMKRYWQVFEERYGFTSSLSALDLILCEGPYAQRTALKKEK